MVDRDSVKHLIAESWMSQFWLDLAGFLDLKLESGDENLFRENLLSHQCFLALNCQMKLDPRLLFKQGKTALSKLKYESKFVPQRKLYVPYALYNGQSLGRIRPDLVR